MTSNVSFLTNCKENFKRRTWATLLMGLFFFIANIITPVILVSQVDKEHNNFKNIIADFHALFSLNILISVFIVILAILFALQGYSYLFNRRKMDFYLSVPLSTKRRFHAIQLTSIFTFILLYLITGLLGLLIGTTGDLTSALCVQDFFIAFLINLFLFISIYELTCIAVMMTGHVIVSILALGIFSCYELFAHLLHSAYVSSFMHHLLPSDLDFILTSPFYPYYNLVDVLSFSNGSETPDSSLYMINILWLVGFCVVFYLIAYILYRKRPTDATDRALSFSKTKPWISICIQVLAALGGGLFFYSISWQKTGMAIFGIFLGAFLIFCMMNIIYEFDIKAIFKRWYTLVISIAIALLYFIFLSCDFFGVDTYIPDESKIESCGIVSSELLHLVNNNSNYYIFSEEAKQICKDMKITDSKPFIEIANIALAQEQNNELPDGNSYFTNYTLSFKLTNGRTIYRRYNLGLENIESQLTKILESTDNKNFIKKRIDYSTSSKKKSTLYFSNGVYEIHLSSEKKPELLEAYFKDINQLSYQENFLEAPLASWLFYPTKGNSIYLPIYKNFSCTLALLDQYNLQKKLTLNSSEIEKIQVHLYPLNSDVEVYGDNEDIKYAVQEEYVDNNYIDVIDDPKEIDFLLQNIHPRKYANTINSSTNIVTYNFEKYYLDITVFPKVGTEHEEEIYETHFFFSGDLPTFVGFSN